MSSRQKKLQDIMESIPGTKEVVNERMVSDEFAARMLLAEARRRKRMVETEGVFAYMKSSQPNKNVNKLYLANTIRSVEGHNKRQEEEKCWTIQRIDKQKEISPREDRRRKRRRDEEIRSTPSRLPKGAESLKSREYWAEKKQSKREELESKLGSTIKSVSLANAPDFSEGESVHSESSRGVKKSKKKMKKIDKKAKKSKKSKKSKRKKYCHSSED